MFVMIFGFPPFYSDHAKSAVEDKIIYRKIKYARRNTLICVL